MLNIDKLFRFAKPENPLLRFQSTMQIAAPTIPSAGIANRNNRFGDSKGNSNSVSVIKCTASALRTWKQNALHVHGLYNRWKENALILYHSNT